MNYRLKEYVEIIRDKYIHKMTTKKRETSGAYG